MKYIYKITSSTWSLPCMKLININFLLLSIEDRFVKETQEPVKKGMIVYQVIAFWVLLVLIYFHIKILFPVERSAKKSVTQEEKVKGILQGCCTIQ